MAASRSYTSASRAVALITGANRGLGFALAQQLVRLGGYHVIAAARSWQREAGSPWNVLDAAHCEAQKTPTRHIGELSFVELDVASDASRYALTGQLADVLGTEQRLNIVVNNAGVYINGWTPEAFSKCIATNTMGPLRLAQQLAPLYAPDAHIINVSAAYAKLRFVSDEYKAAITSATTVDELESKLVFNPEDAKMKADAVVPAYKVSKVALNHGTRLLATQFKGTARVNAVEPGWCKTDMGGSGAPRTASDGARSIFGVLVGDASVIGTGNYYNFAGKQTPFE